MVDPEHSTHHLHPNGDLEKVRFDLSSEDAREGVEAEVLWAERTGDGRYRIESIPFYVYGVSYKDVVTAEPVEGRLRFTAVAERGGHSTYRVLLTDQRGFRGSAFQNAWPPLETLGCRHEVARLRWVAVDVPDSTDVLAVYRLLEAGASAGIWSFEEAHYGHSL